MLMQGAKRVREPENEGPNKKPHSDIYFIELLVETMKGNDNLWPLLEAKAAQETTENNVREILSYIALAPLERLFNYLKNINTPIASPVMAETIVWAQENPHAQQLLFQYASERKIVLTAELQNQIMQSTSPEKRFGVSVRLGCYNDNVRLGSS